MTEIAWSTAARGARVVPVLLIAGLPAVFVPAGVTLTGWSAGTPDPAWWPGSTFADWSEFVRPWLDLSQPVAWDERAEPVQPEMLNVGAVTLRFHDVGLRADGTGGAATEMFASADAALGTWITTDLLPDGSQTVVAVASTDGLPSEGYLYLGRETIRYTSKTSTAFSIGSGGVYRGRFGSPVLWHRASGNNNDAIGSAFVADRPLEVFGRTATLWFAELNSAGSIVAISLGFYGVVGGGFMVADDAEAWTLRLDHVVKRLGQPLRGDTIAVGGYLHTNPDGTRGNTAPLSAPGSLAPTGEWWTDAVGGTAVVNALTIASAAPDNGGWHATRESYIAALNDAAATLVSSPGWIRYSILPGGALSLDDFFGTGNNYTLHASWPWDSPAATSTSYTDNHLVTSTKPFPAAWVPIGAGGTRVYLSADDFGRVPALPSATLPDTDVAWLLCMGDEDRPRYARITAATSGSGVYYLTCEALTRDVEQTDAFGLGPFGFVVTEPDGARLGCYVRAATWVDALEELVSSFDTSLGVGVADVFDFDDMRAVAARYAGPFAGPREYLVDLSQSVLEIVTNECRLNGYALALRGGRISVARFAEFAPTEALSLTFVTEDLAAESPRPLYERGAQGIVNAVRYLSPDTRERFNFVDATSQNAYGPGTGAIEATLPRSFAATARTLSGSLGALAAQSAAMLGPVRFPYGTVTFTTTLHRAGVLVGDVCGLTLWRVPNERGSRGVSGAVGQILSRALTLYGDGRGAVTFTARLSRADLAGWAPTVLVAAGGISGANVTADTATFGAAGFAPSGSTGGAEFFSVGDAVRLVEIDSAAPTASTSHTVAAVGGSTLTLSPAPSGTFATLAADAVKVMVVADDWSSATTDQRAYAYLADTSHRLDASTRARVYAA